MNDCIHVTEDLGHCILFPVECKNPAGKGCYLSVTERDRFLDAMRKEPLK